MRSNNNIENGAELKQVAVDPTALEKHAHYFVGIGGKFTAESMQSQLETLGGDAEKSASLIAKGTMHVASVSGCPYARFFGGGSFQSKDLPKLLHPSDTGIIDKDGNLNEVIFNELAKHAIEVEIEDKETQKKKIVKVLSLKEIQQFKEKDSHQERWNNASCIEKLRGSFGSKGEFNLLFGLLSDVKKDGVNYISVERLHDFYTNSEPFFVEIATHHALEKMSVPIKQPEGEYLGSTMIRLRK